MADQPNTLIEESSPYLLQHAYNPVDWYPWGTEALSRAKNENKLIIISVGYAACHWCHVMEEESFENDSVAAVMNTNFVSIKVDREERPDIDQIYMDAVQLMTGSGGWPLNVICLPDGRPIFGGTYFPKEQWIAALDQLATLYQENPDKATEYAENLQEGIRQNNLIQVNNDNRDINLAEIDSIVNKWSQNFDGIEGGVGKQNKFPLPNNYDFLMRYAFQKQDAELKAFVNLTLDKIALGGINDHINGGFSRYSVDPRWHIPHFEKMLYDNAQLIELYSKAYSLENKQLYKDAVYNTFNFLETELSDGQGAYYSSLDADSKNEEGHLEEGAFYTFTEEEIDANINSDQLVLFKNLYQVNSKGFWENGRYQLIQKESLNDFAINENIELEWLQETVSNWKNTLKELRSQKERPRLDDKVLCSWNALNIRANTAAYKAFDDNQFLEAALKTASFIETKLLSEEGSLYRNYKNGKVSINAYLEDYAQVISAYIELYQVSRDEKWIRLAKQLTDYCFDHFFDSESREFFFTSDMDPALIQRKIEMEDNVIPASNSTMAENLYNLSLIYGNSFYKKTSEQMLATAMPLAKSYGGAYSNWLNLALNHVGTYYEVAVSGPEAETKQKEFYGKYLPNTIIVAKESDSQIPLMQDRFSESETLIFVCIEGSCKLPEEKSTKAIQGLNMSLK
jgi:hypothetical protein